MNFLRQLKEQFDKIWTNFTKTQKIVVGGVSLTVFVFLVFLAFFLGKTDYEPLYPELSFTDSALIASKLKDMKVDYKLGSDGTTILVPAKQKHQLRLDLANTLPQGGVIGFESFNETRFGETDKDKRVRYLAALQGELTRTIQQMEEVETAKVHIVLPEPSLFTEDSKPTTASVLLKLKPYATMDKLKIRSIIYFISHSVEGLLPENVTVIDVYGNLLSEGVIKNDAESELVTANLTVNQIAIKKQFEEDLSQSLQSMLEKVLGTGKAVVRASVEMDFDQVETSSEEFGDNVVRSEQISEHFSEGTSPNNLGIVGTESNLTDIPSYPTAEVGQTSSETTEIIRNYEINRYLETRKKAPGEIKRLSVAVIIDGQLSTQEEANIQNIIAGAAGINEARGDRVSITSLAFNTDNLAELREQMEKETARQNMMELIKYGIIALGTLALIALVVIYGRKSLARRAQMEEAGALASVSEQMAGQLSPEDLEKVEIQKKIDKIVKTQPESIAKVVRTWMAEDLR